MAMDMASIQVWCTGGEGKEGTVIATTPHGGVTGFGRTVDGSGAPCKAPGDV